jgi:hypothetical protein
VRVRGAHGEPPRGRVLDTLPAEAGVLLVDDDDVKITGRHEGFS